MTIQTTGAITPAQVIKLRGVYDAIASEPWFYDTEDSRQELYRIVVHNFRLRHSEEDDLLRVCKEIAIARVSAIIPPASG